MVRWKVSRSLDSSHRIQPPSAEAGAARTSRESATGRRQAGSFYSIAGVGSARGIGIIRALAWTRAVIVSAGAAACLAGCITGAPIPPTYTQDELKAICARNGFRWYPDDLTGGFCERR